MEVNNRQTQGQIHKRRMNALRKRIQFLDERIAIVESNGVPANYDRSERAAIRYALAVLEEIDQNLEPIERTMILEGAIIRLREQRNGGIDVTES